MQGAMRLRSAQNRLEGADMYAVIKTGGKQYKVAAGEKIKIEQIAADVGQEIVIEERGHILNYELGASAIIAGVTIRPVRSADGSGILTWPEVAEVLSTDGIYDHTQTGLLCLENTHNLAGGTVMSAEHCAELCDNAHSAGIPVHMDGARIFNAAVASGSSVAELTRHCDSVQFCLSKGLGAPVGSVLVGSKEFIDEARIWRTRS